MFSTPLTCCSIGVATDSETSWALAPGQVQSTCTIGGEICGYWATGSVNSAIPPARVMTIDSTEAKIGRSMKKREITADPPEGPGSRPIPGPGRRTAGQEPRPGAALATDSPRPHPPGGVLVWGGAAGYGLRPVSAPDGAAGPFPMSAAGAAVGPRSPSATAVAAPGGLGDSSTSYLTSTPGRMRWRPR